MPNDEKPRVFITILPSFYERIVSRAAQDRLASFARVDRNLEERLLGEDELSRRIAEVDAVIVGWPGQSNGLSGATIAAATRLRIIGQLGQSVKEIDTAAALARGITVVNGPAAFANGVAEFTLGLILAGRHRIVDHDRRVRSGTEAWGRQGSGHLGRELAGKVVGLIGFGWIGRRVAALLRPFDVTLLVHDPHAAPDSLAAAGAQAASLEELLAHSDVVSLHAGLTEATRGLIGRRELALMKSDALLVNTARGGLVDHAALIARLREVPSMTAALDVFACEPLPEDDPIRGMENVLLSPHRSGHTEEAYERVGLEVVEDFRRFFSGAAPVNRLTAETIARMS